MRLHAQEQEQLVSVAFWNLENLFDIQNDTLTLDDQRTPSGNYHWSKTRYERKLKHLAEVIQHMDGIQKTVPDILGFCEVENATVIQELNQTLKNSPYELIHKDSPDRRGIDVGLFYNADKLFIQNYVYRTLKIYDQDHRRRYTRDQLLVEVLIDSYKIYLIVNHWPSRSGGESKSKPNRIKAAQLNLKLIDSIRKQDPEAMIITMGDFNDNPDSTSFKQILKTSATPYFSTQTKLYNPMEALYNKGVGSLVYRGAWNLFDQFYISSNLTDLSPLRFYKAIVYKPEQMITTSGLYKGYPKRTYSGTSYLGGYSDHYPIVMYLYKTKKRVPKDSL